MNHVTYIRNVLTIDAVRIKCSYEIIDAFEVSGIVVVLLDPDANMGKAPCEGQQARQYQNLMAYNFAGEKLWNAELPTEKNSDVYWKLSSQTPLIAYSFSSYECEISLATGKIAKTSFYK